MRSFTNPLSCAGVYKRQLAVKETCDDPEQYTVQKEASSSGPINCAVKAKYPTTEKYDF